MYNVNVILIIVYMYIGDHSVWAFTTNWAVLNIGAIFKFVEELAHDVILCTECNKIYW